MNSSWLCQRLGLIVIIFLFITPLVIGWSMPQIYSEESFINDNPQYEGYDRHSQMAGLKFMPPCTPFGADATCGFDMLLFGYWFGLIMVGSLFLPLIKEQNLLFRSKSE